MARAPIFAVIGVLLLSSAFGQTANYGNFVNRNIVRTIDLTSQFAKHKLVITLENTDNKAANSFFLAFDESQSLSFVQVTDANGKVLNTHTDATTNGANLVKVDLATPLAAAATADFTVNAVFTHAMKPFPAAIAQSERQLVRYSENHYVSSPYRTTTQTTTVKLASGNVESKTERNPTSLKGDTITYGPYNEVEAFASSPFTVHFENNRPFLTVTRLTKEIEISHWGNLAVELTYDVIRNDGAALKGTFSRYDYQRNPAGTPAVVAGLRAVLPIRAHDIYYRDEIGNISSSNLNVVSNGLAMDITPRFPLFGGWKNAFYMGYNLPLYENLFIDSRDSSLYVLNTTFGSGLEDIVIDELVVRVILPEGAKNIDVHTPFPIDEKSWATHFTYLDTSGRPVLILTKRNVVGEHNQYFQVTYNFSSTSLMHEPFLLIAAYFTFFLTVMAYVRLNLKIGPAKKRTPREEKLDDLLARLRDVVDQRSEQHALLDAALVKLWKSKSEAAYNTEKKRVEANLAACKGEARRILTELDEVDAERARAVRLLEQKEERKTATQENIHKNEIDYRIHKRVGKNAYETSKTDYERAYTVVDEDIEGTVADLTEGL
eukprot:TRINITY_DN1121_c0_g1_i1.p1 TRINITY_DN1121_c0_g1~~TRINITY_DN1121_c0_g1_i1.p1  ORF type:complete len:638 (+),score=160.45 TRINITY_DN1121_c0_g1_i1:103-1914(+)